MRRVLSSSQLIPHKIHYVNQSLICCPLPLWLMSLLTEAATSCACVGLSDAVDEVAARYELPRAGLRHQPLAQQQLDAAVVGFGYLGELMFEPSYDHE